VIGLADLQCLLMPFTSDKIGKGANPGKLAIEAVDPILVVNLRPPSVSGVSCPEVLRQADYSFGRATEGERNSPWRK
jgi:hypothetical protein